MSEEKQQETMQELSDEELSAVAGGIVAFTCWSNSEKDDGLEKGHQGTGRIDPSSMD